MTEQSKLKSLQVNIRGMHCRSCEILTEKNLAKVAGVTRAHTDFKKGVADIFYDTTAPRLEDIEKAINKAGYSIGIDDKKLWVSKNMEDYQELVMAAGTLFIVYAIARVSGVLDLNFHFSAAPSLFVVVLVGLTAGVSTCMALLGGLVLGVSARYSELHPESTPMQKFRPHLFFNLGRLISYTLLGGVIGLAGSALHFSSSVLGFVIMVLGIVMVLLGLKLIEIFPRLSFGFIALPKSISQLLGIGRDVQEYSHKNALITGALTFFIPCGFTQAMQLYAVSTGSFVQGATIMFLFALGTLPGLLGVGGLAAVIKGKFARQFFKFAGLVVIILGLWNISSGFNLTGISLSQVGDAKPLHVNDALDSTMENGKQVVTMTQSAGGYAPNKFTIKKGIPVQWVIDATNQYACTSSIFIPTMGISKTLVEGKNTISFTPTEVGALKFTCSMGMYSGVFNVVD